MCKRETTEYDTECVHSIALTTLSGQSALRRQLRLRPRRPVQAPARSHRTLRSLPPRDSHQPQLVRFSVKTLLLPSLGPPVRKPSGVTIGRICASVVQQIPGSASTSPMAIPFVHRVSRLCSRSPPHFRPVAIHHHLARTHGTVYSLAS